MKKALYTIGVDFGTLSARAVVADSRNGSILASCQSSYAHGVLSEQLPDGTPLPPQWALQVPGDYPEALTAAYPGRCQSLTQILSTTDARLSGLAEK